MTVNVFGANGAGDAAYNIQRSLRFRNSASASLSRTPASAGNRKTWTWSAWVKRGSLSSNQVLFVSKPSATSDATFTTIGFSSSNTLLVSGYSVQWRNTTQVFRDPSAWYHIVVTWDTTQATAANRVKVYVNGSQVTAFGTTFDPSLNFDGAINQADAHYFCYPDGYSYSYFDGYLTEVNFVDGQGLTPSSFGETDTTTGAWKPKAYSGSRGTNGFYLEFKTSVSENLVAHYTGTISGSSVLNVAGATNGTKGSGVTATTGKSGDGFLFDGTTNGYIDTGIATNYNSEFSVAVWFNTTWTGNGFLVAKNSYYATNQTDFPFNLSLNNGTVSAALDPGGDYSVNLYLNSPLSTYADGNWHHAVIAFTSSTAKLYVDGAEVASAATGFSLSSVSYNWFLGRSPYPYGGGVPGNPYTGKMDDFRLYSRAITATEVTTLYSGAAAPAAIGYDASGNNNHWNPNNISLTPGVTYDSMTDVPTLTSATAANFGVLNQVLPSWWAAPSKGSISNGNLRLVASNGSAFSTFDVNTPGKWYVEMTVTAYNNGPTYHSHFIVSARSGSTFNIIYLPNGNRRMSGVAEAAYGASWTTGDVIAAAIDPANNQVTFYKNGVSQGTLTNTFPSEPVLVGYYAEAVGTDTVDFNFGQRPFTYTPPTGYKALNTYNLPEPTIKKGKLHMDVALVTGTGANADYNGVSEFQPGLISIKSRSVSGRFDWFDTVRGVVNRLDSSTTEPEAPDNDVFGFNPTGFSGSLDNGTTYAAWLWKTGDSAVTNTAGTITSTVSANPTAGISVVTYTGTGANATVGHGLGVAPGMAIFKSRTGTGWLWGVYHAAIGNTGYLRLDGTDSFISSGITFQNTSPSSSVFTIGSAGHVNNSGGSILALCFTAVPGYSAFGSYTGNGSSDGTMVYTGFLPKFVLVKRTDSTGNWDLYDTARNPYNAMNLELFPNSTSAEYNGGRPFDFLSNGFKPRTSVSDTNASGGTYVYMAFASNPFKYSLAR